MATFVLTMNDAEDRPRMGGKAAALARMTSAGLPVPAWFVVTPEAFDASLSASQADSLARGADPRELRECLADLRPCEAVAAEVGTRIAAFGGDVRAVAVRSSCPDEDGLSHSFAGQFDSYLFVPLNEVMRRIGDVWRSGFNERAIAYRAERGLPLTRLAPAVLIQRMVDADAAGVAFGADPVSGRRGIAVVSAVYGLGTSLVGGESDADTFRVSPEGRVIDRVIARKTVAHRHDPAAADHLRRDPPPDGHVAAPVIDDATIVRVAGLARRAGDQFGRPQDIEWAIRGGELFLLQSRPITTLVSLIDPDGISAIWDNSNIAESYSGITTPLTFSFARRAYEGVYRQFCVLMGVPGGKIAEHDDMFRRMLGLIRGRIYYNLLNWYRLLALLPGFTANRGFMEQMMGVREGLPESVASSLATATRGERIRDRLRFAGTVIGLIRCHYALDRDIRRFQRRLDQALEPPPTPMSRMRIDELTAAYRSLEQQLISRWDAPLVNDFFAMIFFGVLRKLTAKWLGDKDDTLHNNLISGEGGIISAEPARLITQMGRLAAANPDVTRALCEDGLGSALAAIRSQPELHRVYAAYVARFGDRCLQELKLESLTLVDDPTPLLRSIGHTARRIQAGQMPAGGADQSLRLAGEGRVAEALRRSPLRRAIFRWVLRHARSRVRDRENLRFERTRLFGRVRTIFVEIGRRLAAEGLLDEARHVFYLEVEEVLGFVEGTATTTDLRSLVKIRMAEFARFHALPQPASRCETRGAVNIGNTFASPKRPPPHDAADDALRGIGCCPGVVRGPVRIIRDPRGAEIQRGQILVAEQTDPGWIMLFPAAAGVLVERGSLLSHSAIVAREMGIPAIVSISELTTRLREGQWVEMDGATGVVRLLATPNHEEAGVGK